MSDIIATRHHKILASRAGQIKTNLLAFHGGAPYIDARLCRWPSETDIDWAGSSGSQGNERSFGNAGSTSTIGRKQRAFLINYARRVAEKINQYVFKTAPVRDGADPRFLADVTQTGMSASQFMGQVSAMLTVCRWCWIGVDRPPSNGPQSVAAVEASGDRVYWQIYAPTEVVDWSYDRTGRLAWLITEREEYVNSDPRSEPKTVSTRYLYTPGKVTRMVYDEKRERFTESVELLLGIQSIPFVRVGHISADPWWFDDLERVQRSIMDLQSSLDTSIFKAVFPLLVVGASFRDAMQIAQIDEVEAKRRVSTGHPIVETNEESGITRWLSGSTADLAFIRTEIEKRSQELYDIVGMAMKMPESRQVASAEAKAWDHLDTEAVLAERAEVLEHAEATAVEMSARLGGGTFSAYTPSYAKAFDLSDFAADMQAIVMASGLPLPPKAEAMLRTATIKAIGKQFDLGTQDVRDAIAESNAYQDPGDIVPG